MSKPFFSHTDEDGDTVEVSKASNHITVLSAISDDNNYVSVALTAGAARDLAAKLTEWAGEPVPPFKVGDRVRVTEEMNPDHDGQVGTVRSARPALRGDRDWVYDVTLDNGHYVAAYDLEHYTGPDYAAIAASFKPGDLAIVGDKPGTHANGAGCVEPQFAGKAVTIVAKEEDMRGAFGPCTHAGPWAEVVRVALGNGDTNYIHVAHLTKVQAVKW